MDLLANKPATHMAINLERKARQAVEKTNDHFLYQNIRSGIGMMLEDRTTSFFFGVLIVIGILGLVGPMIAPYDHTATQYNDDGTVASVDSPSTDHLLGTTFDGQDVLSLLLVGARPTVITGLVGGLIIITVGGTIGITAGYVGGNVEEVLMRFTDFIYGVPLLPFAIVLVSFLGIGFIQSIMIIGLVLWRGSARVIRSQVLQVKEYPFIEAARATGASRSRIIYKHIIPNVAPMAILFFAMGVGSSILIQAGLSFLGVSDPFTPSWAVMVRNAFNSGYMSIAWWWSLPPGFLIGITVLSTFMFGRGYESLANGDASQSVEQNAI